MLETCSIFFSATWDKKDEIFEKKARDKQGTKNQKSRKIQRGKSIFIRHAISSFFSTHVGWGSKLESFQRSRKCHLLMGGCFHGRESTWGGKSLPHVWRLPPTPRMLGKGPRIVEERATHCLLSSLYNEALLSSFLEF